MADNRLIAGREVIFVCSRVLNSGPRFWEEAVVKPVFCIGQVGAGEILEAIYKGARGVTLFGCSEGLCRHEKGPEIAQSQVKIAREIFRRLGRTQDCVRFLTAGEGLMDEGSVSTEAGSEPIQPPEESFALPKEFSPAEFVCLDCGRCSGICPVARTGIGFSPRRLIQEALKEGGRVQTRALYACIGCDLCSTVCPSGKSFARTVERLRALGYACGLNPVLAHGGIFQTIGRIQAKSSVGQNRRDWLSPELKLAEASETGLFIGCLPYFQVVFEHLGVNLLKTVNNTIALLNRAGIVPMVLKDECCCGHDLLWLGDRDNAIRLARKNLLQLESAGVKRLVFLCPECLHTFKVEYPQLVGDVKVQLLHITELLAQCGFQIEKNSRTGLHLRVTYQDPCRLGRQLGVYDAPRQLITEAAQGELVEMRHNRHQALCCGGTQWLECGAAVRLLQEQRFQEASATGAELLVTACPRCDIHLACARHRNSESEIKIVNIVDLLKGDG